MKNKTKQRLKNGITTGLSAGLIGYLAKGPRRGLALGGAMGLAAALQDPSKQKEIDDIVDLRQKEKRAMTRLSKEMLQSFADELEKAAGIPKGLRELAKKKQRWGAGEYAVRREAAHKFGNKATKPRKYEIWATGSGLEARTPKNPNPSQLSVKADVNEGKRWRKMSKEQLGKFEKTKTSGAASIAGLSGLVALEGSGAFNKKKSTKERAMSGAAGAATGAILGDELMHHPSIGPKLRSGFNAAKGLLTKKAAPSQAAMMKMHAMVDASKAAKNVAPAAAQGTLRPASQAAHAGYADFMPAGRFSGAGQGLPSIQQRSMQHAQKVMAAGGGKMAPLQRVSAGAAQTGGVLGRIGKMFRGA